MEIGKSNPKTSSSNIGQVFYYLEITCSFGEKEDMSSIKKYIVNRLEECGHSNPKINISDSPKKFSFTVSLYDFLETKRLKNVKNLSGNKVSFILQGEMTEGVNSTFRVDDMEENGQSLLEYELQKINFKSIVEIKKVNPPCRFTVCFSDEKQLQDIQSLGEFSLSNGKKCFSRVPNTSKPKSNLDSSPKTSSSYGSNLDSSPKTNTSIDSNSETNVHCAPKDKPQDKSKDKSQDKSKDKCKDKPKDKPSESPKELVYYVKFVGLLGHQEYLENLLRKDLKLTSLIKCVPIEDMGDFFFVAQFVNESHAQIASEINIVLGQNQRLIGSKYNPQNQLTIVNIIGLNPNEEDFLKNYLLKNKLNFTIIVPTTKKEKFSFYVFTDTLEEAKKITVHQFTTTKKISALLIPPSTSVYQKELDLNDFEMQKFSGFVRNYFGVVCSTEGKRISVKLQDNNRVQKLEGCIKFIQTGLKIYKYEVPEANRKEFVDFIHRSKDTVFFAYYFSNDTVQIKLIGRKNADFLYYKRISLGELKVSEDLLRRTLIIKYDILSIVNKDKGYTDLYGFEAKSVENAKLEVLGILREMEKSQETIKKVSDFKLDFLLKNDLKSIEKEFGVTIILRFVDNSIVVMGARSRVISAVDKLNELLQLLFSQTYLLEDLLNRYTYKPLISFFHRKLQIFLEELKSEDVSFLAEYQTLEDTSSKFSNKILATKKVIVSFRVTCRGQNKLKEVKRDIEEFFDGFESRAINAQNVTQAIYQSILYKKDLFQGYSINMYWNQIKREILLFGTKEEVDTIARNISIFLSDKAFITKEITFDSLIARHYKFKNEKKWNEIYSNAKVTLDEKGFIISGESKNVDDCLKKLEQDIQNFQRNLIIKKIQVKKSLLEYIYANKKAFFSGLPATVHVEKFQPSSSGLESLSFNNRNIYLCQSDITKERTDAIVNAANSRLQHGGGVASAIAIAAGTSMIDECNQYIKNNGELKVGQSIVTTKGNLACKKCLIHTVGPRWADDLNPEELLFRTVNSALVEAEKMGCVSISLPAISCGIFGFPPEFGAAVILSSIEAFFQSCVSIKTVRIIIKDDETISAFQKTFKEIQFSSVQNVLVSLRSKFSKQKDIAQRNSAQGITLWSWQDDDKSFIDYDQSLSFTIEEAYQKYLMNYQGPTFDLIIDSIKYKSGAKYRFDLIDMTQTNIATKYTRKIKRQETTQASQKGIYEIVESPKTKNKEDIEIPDRDNYLTLIGESKDIEVSEKKLFSDIDKVWIKDSFDFKNAILIDEEKESYKLTALSFDLEVSWEGNKITLEGLEKNISNAKLKIIEDFALSQSLKGQIDFPLEWQPQENAVEKFEVQKDTPEWNMVSGRFGETLKLDRIAKIERVQNKFLWTKYQYEKQLIKIKSNSSDVNEKYLFHGTRSTNPSKIYQGDEGFDMRYCEKGMWGIGNYFAVNSSYSESYGSRDSSGLRCFFLATVITGESKTCQPDNSLRKPHEKPPKPGSNVVELYDSLNGETGGSKVYIIYDNKKAYPSYLIYFN